MVIFIEALTTHRPKDEKTKTDRETSIPENDCRNLFPTEREPERTYKTQNKRINW